MKYEMKLQPDMFEMIKNGTKTYELRLCDDKRKKVNINDIIEFTNLGNNEKLSTNVEGIHYFNSFKDLYNVIPLMECGYTEDNIADAKPSDMGKYYSKEEQDKYGVVAFKISVI